MLSRVSYTQVYRLRFTHLCARSSDDNRFVYFRLTPPVIEWRWQPKPVPTTRQAKAIFLFYFFFSSLSTPIVVECVCRM